MQIGTRAQQLGKLVSSANERQITHLAFKEVVVRNLREHYKQHDVAMPAVLVDPEGILRAIEELLGRQPMPDQLVRHAHVAVVAFVMCLAVALGGDVELLRPLARVNRESVELDDGGGDDDDGDRDRDVIASLPDDGDAAAGSDERAQPSSQPRVHSAEPARIGAAAAAAVLAARHGPPQSLLGAACSVSGGTRCWLRMARPSAAPTPA